MRMCANMHAINTTNYDIHTQIYARSTSTYDNIRLNTNRFNLKMAKFVSKVRYFLNSALIPVFVTRN